jgi:hypothetical protein
LWRTAVAAVLLLFAGPAFGFWAAVLRLWNASLLLLTLSAGVLGCGLVLRTDALNCFVEERDLAAFRRGLAET